MIDASATRVSLLKPENGPAMQFFAGRQFRDYFSAQASYGWNSNDVAFTGTSFAGGRETTFEQARSSRQNSAGGDAMIYFRPRTSRLRPYLSGGAGVVHLSSTAGRTLIAKGSPILPAEKFSHTNVYWRTTVGMDVRLAGGWWFRYSFFETLSNNGLSSELAPPGQRRLLNFQSQFGIFRTF